MWLGKAMAWPGEQLRLQTHRKGFQRMLPCQGGLWIHSTYVTKHADSHFQSRHWYSEVLQFHQWRPTLSKPVCGRTKLCINNNSKRKRGGVNSKCKPFKTQQWRQIGESMEWLPRGAYCPGHEHAADTTVSGTGKLRQVSLCEHVCLSQATWVITDHSPSICSPQTAPLSPASCWSTDALWPGSRALSSGSLQKGTALAPLHCYCSLNKILS